MKLTRPVPNSPITALAPALALLASLAIGTGCHHQRRVHTSHSIPVYVEREPNDAVLDANDFGTLVPGDHFFIDGYSTDDFSDPFDGFAFTSAGPVHVDFRLWVTHASADFDVCIYDPQLDVTVDCFQTSNDPEQGGVDVTSGGLEFHLVVEPFVGSSSYSMEIIASPLYLAREAEPGAASIRASAPEAFEALPAGEATGRDARAFEEYGRRTAAGSTTQTVRTFEVDPETGAITESVVVLKNDPPSSPSSD